LSAWPTSIRFLPSLTLWVRLAGPPLEPEPYVVAVSVESPILLRNLKEVLAELEADGTLARLRVKWLGEAAGE